MKSKTKRTFKLFSPVVFTICVLFICCKEQPGHSILEFDKEMFYQEWAAWEAQGITNYSFVRKAEIHSPFPSSAYYLSTVKDKTLIKVESLDGRYYSIPICMPTISAHYIVFEDISKIHKYSCGYIRIVYNSDYHYPEVIDFYLPEGGKNGLGSETHYLSEFIPLSSVTED